MTSITMTKWIVEYDTTERFSEMGHESQAVVKKRFVFSTKKAADEFVSQIDQVQAQRTMGGAAVSVSRLE
jgi:hypothetical protein